MFFFSLHSLLSAHKQNISLFLYVIVKSQLDKKNIAFNFLSTIKKILFVYDYDNVNDFPTSKIKKAEEKPFSQPKKPQRNDKRAK
jgi:hypothetical protein